MRPVDVVAPPNYAVVVVADENVNVPAFAAGSATAICYATPGGFQQTIAWVQDELLDKTVFNNAFPNPSTPLNRGRTRNMLRSRLETIYRTSRADMVAMIGDFCSFCEMPLLGYLLATEHRAAKSIYPTYTTWWWNFLLACRDCNSFKGNLPPRATAAGWSPVVGPNENDLVNAIKDNYYWPDIDQDTYRRIRVRFWMNTHAPVPVRLTGVEFADRDNVLVSSTMTVVRATVWQGGATRVNRYIEARIYNRFPNVAGGRTIPLTGLDDEETGRAAARTRAWLTVCLNIDLILTGINGLPPANVQAVFTMGWRMMLLASVNAGFYSTWVRVLSKQGVPANVAAGPHNNLGEMFVFDTQAANAFNPLAVFRGTDPAQVP